MPTTRITIERRLRPLRVGYRANPSSVDEVRRAIEVATAQWGGLLHPIIPVFRRRPTGWHQGPLRAPTAREIEAAYLKSFECDFVVDAQLGAADRKDSLRDITFDQLVTPDNWGHITAGLAADAVYGHVWHQEFRFDSARRVPAALPRSPSGPMELFIEACFGRFSAERPDLEARYRKAFDADDLVVSPESLLRGFAAVRSPGFLTPLTLGVYGLSISPRERSRELSILLLDGTRVSDIVDFWNLRAAGHPVIPVPIQWKGGLVEPLAELILGSEYAQERRHVELRGTHLGDDETLAAFQRELAEKGVEIWRGHYPEPSHFHFGLQAASCDAVTDEVEVEVSAEGTCRLPLLSPEAARDYHGPNHGWVTVLNVRHWSAADDGSVAAYIPSELGLVSELLARWSLLVLRATTEGLAAVGGTLRDHVDLVLPTSRDIVHAVLRKRGFEPAASDAGVVAEKLIRQLGGLPLVGYLSSHDLLELLNRAAITTAVVEDDNDESRRLHVPFIKHQEVLRVLRGFLGNDSDRQRAYLRQLIERNVLRAGLVLKCSECTYPNWMETAAIRDRLQCNRCLGTYRFPHENPPDRGSWAYRPTGMCSVEDYARGGYTTAHALRFLAPSGLSPMVWSTGTTLNDGLEFDFAALRQRRDDYPAFLFGEAKSHGPFKPRDFDRGRSLLNLFPDATMVFATLEEHFSEAEREAAVQLARPITQSARDVPLDARVILLTRLELLHPQGPPYCWEDTEGRSERIARAATSYVRDDLPTWADITLQQHAAVGPHHDWMTEQLDRVKPARRSPRRRRR